MTHAGIRTDATIVVVAAALLVPGCRLVTGMRTGTASGFSVDVAVGTDGFGWAPPEDQLGCSRDEAYPGGVAAALYAALKDDCTACRREELSFRLFLLNDPVGRRATVISLVLVDPEPEESAPTLEALSALLRRTRLPPLRRPRCSIEVSTKPSPRP